MRLLPKTHQPGSSILDTSLIDKNIYLGNAICCQEHFDESLREKGVLNIISLEDYKTDGISGVKEYLWLPTRDRYAPSVDQLKEGISKIEEHISKDEKVYVHCTYGMGRSATLLAAYLMKDKGLTIDEAEAFMRKNRPIVDITDHQKEGLRDYQKLLD